MTDVAPAGQRPDSDSWRTYDEFADGIATYRLPGVSLDGTKLSLELHDGTTLALEFDGHSVQWEAAGSIASAAGTRDPYDAVAVREEIIFVNLPLTSRDREALTLVYSRVTNRAAVVHSTIAREGTPGRPQVQQAFFAGTLRGGPVSGAAPGPSRDLIGKRNIYRYSPDHLYEHVYLSSERYCWQCLQGVQRGHGDTDLATVWKFEDGLYIFCFREFRIAVGSVWLHDLSYQLRTTGIFIGLNGAGESEHSTAGGHIYPLGSVTYPDAQPI